MGSGSAEGGIEERRVRHEESFRAFAGDRAATLRRPAYLPCGDRHLAEDLPLPGAIPEQFDPSRSCERTPLDEQQLAELATDPKITLGE